MKRTLALLLSLVLTAVMLCACGSNSTAQSALPAEANTAAVTEGDVTLTDELRAEIKAAYEKLFTQRGFEGAAYVVYRGEEVYAGGAGEAIRNSGVPNSPDVAYQIASNTKQFTAAAILRLCEEGRLSLDDTLGQFYPEYTKGRDITIHSLLSMQSGIPDYLRSYDENGYEDGGTGEPYAPGVASDNTYEQNRDALREHIFSMELLYEQGERYSYSNSNYFLLGGIVEQVAGVSYQVYLRTIIFEPLGMDTAGFINEYDHPDATAAKGYRGINATSWFSYPGVSFGCGDVVASPKDLYKWATALHGGRVLSDEMYRLMTTPHVTDAQSGVSYGYGLMIQRNIGATVYYHGGSIPGFMSMVCYIPGQDYFLAVISNHSNENTAAVASKLTEIFQEKINHN